MLRSFVLACTLGVALAHGDGVQFKYAQMKIMSSCLGEETMVKLFSDMKNACQACKSDANAYNGDLDVSNFVYQQYQGMYKNPLMYQNPGYYTPYNSYYPQTYNTPWRPQPFQQQPFNQQSYNPYYNQFSQQPYQQFSQQPYQQFPQRSNNQQIPQQSIESNNQQRSAQQFPQTPYQQQQQQPIDSNNYNYYPQAQYGAQFQYGNEYGRVKRSPQDSEEPLVQTEVPEAEPEMTQANGIEEDIKSKISNITCVMRTLNLIDADNAPNWDYTTSFLQQLPVGDELKQDLIEGHEFCREFSMCLPLHRMKDPLTKELGRPLAFHKCMNTKKLKTCMKHDHQRLSQQFNSGIENELLSNNSPAEFLMRNDDDHMQNLMSLFQGGIFDF